jgi:hypothetical protein
VVIYLGETVPGVVQHVDQDGRRLVVMTEDGDAVTFLLGAATAIYTAEGRQWGARLAFDDEHSDWT